MVGTYENVLLGHESRKAVERLLQLRPSRSEEVDKLFGFPLTAAGP